MSETDKNPCKEIDLGVHDEIEYLSRKIREVLGTNHIGVPDSNLSREMIEFSRITGIGVRGSK